MKLITSLDFISIKSPVVTLGIFDGVHKGHQHVISTLINTAKSIDGESVMLTFWPHPRIVLNPKLKDQVRLLNTLKEKELNVNKYNVDYLIILPFTTELSKLTTEEFVKTILLDKIKMKALIIGNNHRFGSDGDYNFEAYQLMAKNNNFEVYSVDALKKNDERISSTQIRKFILEGNIKLANNYLGYNYSITGKVVEGSRIGRQIGFPTANIKVEDTLKLIPSLGVYAVMVDVDNKTYKGMLNIGYRPTIIEQEKQVSIEVHLFDFDEDIYNKEVNLNFVDKLRNEKKFNGIEELKLQLEKDKSLALQILSL